MKKRIKKNVTKDDAWCCTCNKTFDIYKDGFNEFEVCVDAGHEVYRDVTQFLSYNSKK